MHTSHTTTGLGPLQKAGIVVLSLNAAGPDALLLDNMLVARALDKEVGDLGSRPLSAQRCSHPHLPLPRGVP